MENNSGTFNKIRAFKTLEEEITKLKEDIRIYRRKEDNRIQDDIDNCNSLQEALSKLAMNIGIDDRYQNYWDSDGGEADPVNIIADIERILIQAGVQVRLEMEEGIWFIPSKVEIQMESNQNIEQNKRDIGEIIRSEINRE